MNKHSNKLSEAIRGNYPVQWCTCMYETLTERGFHENNNDRGDRRQPSDRSSDGRYFGRGAV